MIAGTRSDYEITCMWIEKDPIFADCECFLRIPVLHVRSEGCESVVARKIAGFPFPAAREEILLRSIAAANLRNLPIVIAVVTHGQ